MRGYIHSLMEDAHHVDHTGPGDTVEQEVRCHGQLAIAEPDRVARAALSAAVGEGLAGVADAEHVAVGLIFTPGARAVVPNLSEVGLRGGRKKIARHPGGC